LLLQGKAPFKLSLSTTKHRRFAGEFTRRCKERPTQFFDGIDKKSKWVSQTKISISLIQNSVGHLPNHQRRSQGPSFDPIQAQSAIIPPYQTVMNGRESSEQ
jgi:hypothetical protein